MSEMVDRVARAQFKSDWPSGDFDNHAKGQDRAYRRYMDSARAAIAAMREPTMDMLMDGQVKIVIDESVDGEYNYASRDELQEAWQAMIDAALKPAS